MALASREPWLSRLKSLRRNASGSTGVPHQWPQLNSRKSPQASRIPGSSTRIPGSSEDGSTGAPKQRRTQLRRHQPAGNSGQAAGSGQTAGSTQAGGLPVSEIQIERTCSRCQNIPE